jgi:hypothetical protein
MLNDSLSQILPSLKRLRVAVRCGGSLGRGKDIGGAEVRAEVLRDFGPAHELVHGEELEKLGVKGDLCVAAVFMDAVEEVGLFVVVRGEDDVVDYALEGL